MDIIVLLGPPACGKGTQARYLKEDGYELASMSGLLRARASLGDETGRDIQAAMDAGDLVRDDLVNEAMLAYIDRQLQEGTASLVLDGYPRTLAQARFLAHLMAERGMAPPKVISLEVDDYNVLNERRQMRIAEALAAGKEPRAEDLDEAVFRHRFEDAQTLLGPVVGFFGPAVYPVDGLAGPADVRDAIRSALRDRPSPAGPSFPAFTPG